ncbi:TraB/GumN family protein [Silicimonas algicola]|uniref:TraB family protein n=1 Tax=Silicimonas algicola TaxID=1826607 RepID=A0A316GBZ9_9RHOB|nr:TraB/GumN family protein [Silicimonas algicola]AZQ66132.1 TraB/GumN family protein [Silicimonas algicola]PWK58438.1 hypothetical protein C8D95_101252 [Silicimonas algicola]
MIRVLAAALSALTMSLAPGLAAAQSCGTEDLIAGLDAAQKARLDALVAEHPFAEGTLFRASKDGSDVVVVGTIHLPDPRLQPLVDALEAEVRAADLLILEASAEDEAGLATLAATKPEMFFLTEGPTLIDMLTEAEWSEVTDRLSAIGVPGFMAAKFQPWYLSMTLAVPPCAMTLLQQGQVGLDRQLEIIATDAQVQVATLDDAEALLKLFSDEPMDAQLDGLRVTLETQADGNASTSTLIEAYFDGRVREAWEFGRIQIEDAGVENGAEMFEEVNQSLLVGRNQSWEPLIVDMVDGKNAVIAVGAAHLSGESGVLRSLERAGYDIAPF